MAKIKCKMCGGSIEITDSSVTTVCCEFCGQEQTIPKVDNDRKLSLFNRANAARVNSDFDTALRHYEAIVLEFPTEAEAHWGVCLSRYGIEYVDDPITKKKIPTCHRTLMNSIFDDINYKEAILHADVVAKCFYQEEAETIDRIQKHILAISQREEPYDIFICYKETDEAKRRTRDSVIAQTIYDELTEKGYKVFFARVTLESKLGSQYEPIIYAALKSSKVMLAIGSKVEYFNAVWVKNEWSRFLSFMQEDSNKYLIPCYKDMEAYEMPSEFLALQAQDIDKLGFKQDLLRGIDKIFGRDLVVGQSTVKPTNDNSNLFKRCYMLIEDGEYSKVEDIIENFLLTDPENAEAYAILLLCDLQTSYENLQLNPQDVRKSKNYAKIQRFGDVNLNLMYDKVLLEYYKKQYAKLVSEFSRMPVDSMDIEKYENLLDEFNEIIEFKEAKDYVKKINERIKKIKERNEQYPDLEYVFTLYSNSKIKLQSDGTVVVYKGYTESVKTFNYVDLNEVKVDQHSINFKFNTYELAYITYDKIEEYKVKELCNELRKRLSLFGNTSCEFKYEVAPSQPTSSSSSSYSGSRTTTTDSVDLNLTTGIFSIMGLVCLLIVNVIISMVLSGKGYDSYLDKFWETFGFVFFVSIALLVAQGVKKLRESYLFQLIFDIVAIIIIINNMIQAPYFLTKDTEGLVFFFELVALLLSIVSISIKFKKK